MVTAVTALRTQSRGALGHVSLIEPVESVAIDRRVTGYAAAFSHSPVGMLLLDSDHVIVDANSASASALDCDRMNLLGAGFFAALNAAGLDVSTAAARRILTERPRGGRSHYRFVDRSGARRRVTIDFTAIPNGSSSASYVVGIKDVTDLVGANSRLSSLIMRDPLTGLNNRRGLDQFVEKVLRRGEDPDRVCAILYCDVDDFKSVNDRFGHLVGDELLRTVGARMSHSVRSTDLVARIGGDEFLVALGDLGSVADALSVAQEVRNAIAGPIELSGSRFDVEISIGVAVGTVDSDATALIQRADDALLESKAIHRDPKVRRRAAAS